MKRLLSITDLSAPDVEDLFRVAAEWKARTKAREVRTPLAGHSLALVFEKPSLRTRVTFEVGMAQVGGASVYLAGQDIGLGTRESIPDVAEAVDSPQLLTSDPAIARRVLDLVPHVPTPVWGRDELGAGEMWNSNSTIAWVLARAGLHAESIEPPAGGRAPGWRAGIVVARRD